VMLAATVALTIFVMRRAPIGRKSGIILLIAYILYMAAVASRFVAASPSL